jgi:hypothetical protein
LIRVGTAATTINAKKGRTNGSTETFGQIWATAS